MLVTVPFFDADIYDMSGLLRLGALVWEWPGPRLSGAAGGP